MKKKPVVNYLSESAFGFEGNGVHTAFLNTLAMMRKTGKFEIKANSFGSYDILHAHTFGPLYWVMKWLHRGKKVIHAHAIPETLVGQVRMTWLWMPLFIRYLVFYFNSADTVLCMTQQLKDYLLKMGVSCPLAVVGLPMDLAKFRRSKKLRALGRRRLGLKLDDKVVLCVGQIIPRKGFFDFLAVAKKNPDLKFVWVGEIPFSVASESYAEVKKVVEAKGSNILFPGVFKLHEMPQFFNAADVFFFASLQETFGLAIAEAAACGAPLLLRDLETYRETFGQSYLRAKDVAGFSKALRKLMASSKLRQQYGKKSMNMVKRFETSSMGKDLTKVYAQVLKQP